MNSVSAVVNCSLWMRKLMKNTMPSVAEQQHDHRDGMLKMVWPNGVRPVIPPELTAIASPPAIWYVSQATTPVSATADRHVVVDADHVGAQARIDRDRPVGRSRRGPRRSGRNPTWKFPLLIPDGAGSQPRRGLEPGGAFVTEFMVSPGRSARCQQAPLSARLQNV